MKEARKKGLGLIGSCIGICFPFKSVWPGGHVI